MRHSKSPYLRQKSSSSQPVYTIAYSVLLVLSLISMPHQVSKFDMSSRHSHTEEVSSKKGFYCLLFLDELLESFSEHFRKNYNVSGFCNFRKWAVIRFKSEPRERRTFCYFYPQGVPRQLWKVKNKKHWIASYLASEGAYKTDCLTRNDKKKKILSVFVIRNWIIHNYYVPLHQSPPSQDIIHHHRWWHYCRAEHSDKESRHCFDISSTHCRHHESSFNRRDMVHYRAWSIYPDADSDTYMQYYRTHTMNSTQVMPLLRHIEYRLYTDNRSQPSWVYHPRRWYR